MSDQRKPAIVNITGDIDGRIHIQFANNEVVYMDTGFDTSAFSHLPCLPEINLAAMVYKQHQQILMLQQELSDLKKQFNQGK